MAPSKGADVHVQNRMGAILAPRYQTRQWSNFVAYSDGVVTQRLRTNRSSKVISTGRRPAEARFDRSGVLSDFDLTRVGAAKAIHCGCRRGRRAEASESNIFLVGIGI